MSEHLCRTCGANDPALFEADRLSDCRSCRWRIDKDRAMLKAIEVGGDGLIAFARIAERAIIEKLLETRSFTDTANAFSLSATAVRQTVGNLRRRASRAGWAPEADMRKPAAEGYFVKGVSTLYGADGSVRTQWIKTETDVMARQTALADAVREVCEDWRGRLPPIEPPRHTEDELLAVYPMGDPHIGMLAWKDETGRSFDLAIAERNLTAAMDELVHRAAPAHEALIINLGDYFHTDNATNTTTRSKNHLDVDGRWPKVLRTGVRTFRRIIDRALQKHAKVRVICEIGNHDDHSAIMLAMMLEAAYEKESRVSIDTSPAKFHWHRHGSCLIGSTHGDTCKIDQLPLLMAHDRPQDWGETEHRYWYTGHVHHDSLKEHPGVIVETFRTLAGSDAWHQAAGYRSGRDMKCDIIHKRYGRIQRNIVPINMLGV